MSRKVYHSIQEADKAMEDFAKSGVKVTEGIITLPELSHFKGKFDSEAKEVRQKTVLQPVISSFDYVDKVTKESKVYFRADATVKESETQKSYATGIPYNEETKELLRENSNLSKEFNWRSTAKTDKGRVYLELM